MLIICSILLTGCASNMAVKEDKQAIVLIGQLQDELLKSQDELLKLQDKLLKSREVNADSPDNPEPGSCYAKLQQPDVYYVTSQKVETRAEQQKVVTSAAVYETVLQKVVDKEQTERIEVTPATYKMVDEIVVVRPATTQYEQVPATFKTVIEQIQISPAGKEWLPGRGNIQKIDSVTGQLIHLKSVPAAFETVERQVIDQPVKVRQIAVPEIVKVIRKRVIDVPETSKKVVVATTYKELEVEKVVKAASMQTIAIPAEYKYITKRSKIADGLSVWQKIVCKNDLTSELISNVQQLLNAGGYKVGESDGIMGTATVTGIHNYQRDNYLAVGHLTLKTMASLGVTSKSSVD